MYRKSRVVSPASLPSPSQLNELTAASRQSSSSGLSSMSPGSNQGSPTRRTAWAGFFGTDLPALDESAHSARSDDEDEGLVLALEPKTLADLTRRTLLSADDFKQQHAAAMQGISAAATVTELKKNIRNTLPRFATKLLQNSARLDEYPAGQRALTEWPINTLLLLAEQLLTIARRYHALLVARASELTLAQQPPSPSLKHLTKAINQNQTDYQIKIPIYVENSAAVLAAIEQRLAQVNFKEMREYRVTLLKITNVLKPLLWAPALKDYESLQSLAAQVSGLTSRFSESLAKFAQQQRALGLQPDEPALRMQASTVSSLRTFNIFDGGDDNATALRRWRAVVLSGSHQEESDLNELDLFNLLTVRFV